MQLVHPLPLNENNMENKTSNTKPLIYESPDKGKTVYAREFGSDPSTRWLITQNKK